MQRWKKRVWTSSLISGSVLLIIAAVLMGAVRLVDLLAPRYRQDLANLVTEAIEQPVEVGRIGMRWRRLRPTVELGEVVVLDPDNGLPVFELREIYVPFSWKALFRGKFEPAEVVLSGMAVTLEWRADGSLGVQGIEMLGGGGEGSASGELDVADIVRQLRVLGRVVVKDSQLAWQEFGEPIGLTQLSALNAELNLSSESYSLSVDAELPESLGAAINLVVEVVGDVADTDKLQTNISLHADGLNVQGWLQPMLLPGLELRGDTAEVEMRSSWRGMQPHEAQLLLNAAAQSSWRDGEQLRDLPGLSSDISLRADGEGWVATINSLQYQDADGSGPVTRGSLGYQPLAGGFGTALKASLDVVRLSDLLAWSSVLGLSEGIPVPAAADGELQQLSFAYSGLPGQSPEVKVAADLRRLAIPVTGPLPGVSGLNGQFSYDGAMARVKLNSKSAQIVIPQVFAQPVQLSQLKATLLMQRTKDGFELASQALAVKTETVTAKGRLVFEAYEDERAPDIDLQLDFSATDVRPVKPLIPIAPVLPTAVGDWLRASLLAGVVPQGEMVLRGALADFPYVGEKAGSGEFRVEFDIEQAQLEYAPGWPQVNEVKGHAVFAGQSMHIDARSGAILGVPVSNVRAVIKDFNTPLLNITGRVDAGLEKQLLFLANSPLREDYQGLLDVLTVDGPGALDLQLQLPLADIEQTRVSGDIHIQGARLQFDGLPHPVTDVQGKLRFTEAGLSGTGVTGQFLGLAAKADLSPEKTATGAATRLQAQLDVSLPQHAAQLRPLLGAAAPLEYFVGNTAVGLSGLFDSNGGAQGLQLTSNLLGMAIQLGAPLAKAADDQRELRVGIYPGGERLEIDWHYVDVLHGRVALHTVGDSWRADRGVIQLGPVVETMALPQTAGWTINGSLPVLDMEAMPLSLGGEGEMPVIQAIDVHLGLLKVAGQEIRDMGIRLNPVTNRLNFTGADSEGTLGWKKAGERLMLEGDFKRISLSVPKQVNGAAQTAEPAQPESEPVNPTGLPGLSLNVEQFVLGDQVLGALQLRTQPIANGLRLDLLDLKGKRLELRGGGEWLRINGKSSGELLVNFNSNDIKHLLRASGYAESITAEKADVFVDVNWQPHDSGLVMENLNGKLGFEIENGSLLAVEPGAGRVLSLLSFYALPRRLLLDFSDVMGKGTAFDKLQGRFDVKDGNATTNNMKVVSPSMSIKVQGRVGLAARDYDQTVTIEPELSSNIAIAGAVFGGPVLGLGLWLAQELLDEPFEQVATLTYHLGGSWDDPVIEPVKVVSKNKKKKKLRKRATPGAEADTRVPAERPPESVETTPTGPRK